MKFYLAAIVLLSGCVSAPTPEEQLNQLRTVIPTANWQVVNEKDTSYIFMSRQDNGSYKTYLYRIEMGDSVEVRERSIGIHEGSVHWDFNDRDLRLDRIEKNSAVWKDLRNQAYIFTRVSDSVLQMKLPMESWVFTRTLPISTFLVRKHYDYEHRAQLADSGEVAPRDKQAN